MSGQSGFPEHLAGRLKVMQGDITKEKVDAIVNAANNSLLGGGGVDGAIHRAAGPRLLAECRTLGGCPTGAAKITNGYGLPAKYVIHTVGPVYNGGIHGEAELLERCYLSVFDLVTEYQLKSVSLPAISCGVYGYPLDEAARIALKAADRFLAANREVERLHFVCFNEEVYDAYWEVINEMAAGGTNDSCWSRTSTAP
jgi:O-acetyl-ADP-ribose deacetylase (regulator of RNase III)